MHALKAERDSRVRSVSVASQDSSTPSNSTSSFRQPQQTCSNCVKKALTESHPSSSTHTQLKLLTQPTESNQPQQHDHLPPDNKPARQDSPDATATPQSSHTTQKPTSAPSTSTREKKLIKENKLLQKTIRSLENKHIALQVSFSLFFCLCCLYFLSDFVGCFPYTSSCLFFVFFNFILMFHNNPNSPNLVW